MTIVAAITDPELDKYALLERALEASGFFPALERALAASGKPRERFRIAIKPNLTMMLRRDDVGTYTDPFLVIHLARLLLQRGFANLAVVESQNLYGSWFERRSVVEIAARAGYLEAEGSEARPEAGVASFPVRGGSADGRVELLDLTLDQVSRDLGPPFGVVPLGRAWVEADFRINFAKMKTHFYSLYSLAIKNIYGCLPLQDKVRAYHCQRLVGPLTARVIAALPVHFTIVDGYSAADGWLGVKIKAVARKPHTLIAGEDIVAVDHCGAGLLGLNPNHSVMFAETVKYLPLKPYDVVGQAQTPRPWRNSPRLFALVCRLIEANANIMDFTGALATGGHDDCFPKNRDARSSFKRALYLLTIPANELSDLSRLRLDLKKRLLRRRVLNGRARYPAIAGSEKILALLPYLTPRELSFLSELLASGPSRRPTSSGHYLFANGRELTLPSRMTISNLAITELIDLIWRDGLEPKTIATELTALLELLPTRLADRQGYPDCFS